MILEEHKLNQHENADQSGSWLARGIAIFCRYPPLIDTRVSLKCVAYPVNFSGADSVFSGN